MTYRQKALISLIIVLLLPALMVAQSRTIEQQIDSIIQNYILKNSATVSPRETTGVYCRSNGFGSDCINIQENGRYIIRTSGCWSRNAVMDKGRWKADSTYLYLHSRSGKQQLLSFINHKNEVGLFSDTSLAEWKILMLDANQHQKDFSLPTTDSTLRLYVSMYRKSH